MHSTNLTCDMLAIDLDGTLFDPSGNISQENIRAVRDARNAGILVTLCTGRNLVESHHAARAVEQLEPVIVAGGAIIACPVKQESIQRFPMHTTLVRDLVAELTSHNHAVLVLKDPHAAGFDYLVVSPNGPDAIDPVTRWWFNHFSVPVKYVESIDQDEHPEHTVRLGVAGTRKATAAAAESVRTRFAGRAMMHHFEAVSQKPTDPNDPNTPVILELFDERVNKWTAVSHLAEQHNIQHQRIAAIGDQINDVVLLQNAGLGIAMGNAIDEVKNVANKVTTSNTQNGVANAIQNILKNNW